MRLLCPLLVTLSLAPAANGQDGKVAYADFGHALLSSFGESAAPALPELLERHYARLPLAGFDLRVPKAMLGSKDGVARVASIAGALLDLADRTAEWTTNGPEALKAERAELAALRKFVAAWRDKPAETQPPTLAARKEPCVLILAPDRRNFVGLVGWLGLWKENYREYWWVDANAQFSDLRLQDEGQVQVIALEYAAPKQDGDVTAGFDMNTRERTGLLQHVLQRAAMSWCWRWLGDDCDASFQLGLATDLVIDVLGQNNARSGGSGKEHSTEGQGGFIPGAPSQGGGMPVQNADSTWRHSLGADYFSRPLRQAQKAGEHEVGANKDKLGNFLLHDQTDQHKHLVTAPFLGTSAMDREVVPAAFLDDYLEFHRAYRAAFVHWLQGNGMKTKAASAEQFAVLMRRLAEKAKGVDFDGLCRDLYGVPLSAKDPGTDTLERRFLAWVATNSR
jgi:hypothetical protein